MSRTFYRFRRYARISPTAFVYFCFSFLNLITPWNTTVWMMTVITKEYGHYFALFGVYLIFKFWRANQKRRSIWMIIPMVIFLGPLWDAYSLQDVWRKELQKGLGVETAPGPLLSFKDLILGYGNDELKPESLVYAKRELYELKLDFYKSPVAGPRPFVIVVHGGSWASGDAKQLPELNSYLAAQGYSVAAIDYTLLPGGKWPVPVRDLEAAIAYLKANAEKLGLDASKYFLLGRSAGGQVAGVVAYTTKDPGLKGFIEFYSPMDLEFGYRAGDEDDILGSRAILRNYYGGTPSQEPKNYHDGSPALVVGDSKLPTLMFHGKPDQLVWYKHGEILSTKLQASGAPHAFILFSWATHGFDYNLHGPAGQISTKSILYFLNNFSK